MSSILKTKALGKIYYSEDSRKQSTHALKGIDFEINEGDFTILMGESGAGKSTLLNLLSALDTPTSGQVIYNNKNIFSFSEGKLAEFRREVLGFIFQKLNLLDELSIRENISVPLILNGTPKKDILDKVHNISKKLGVYSLLDKLPSECSGGQVQRIAIARALVTNPKILIADEPTGNLDIKNAEKFLKILKELNEKENITIILVTHDPTIATYGKRVVFIDNGLLTHDINSKDYTKDAYYTKIVKLLSQNDNPIIPNIDESFKENTSNEHEGEILSRIKKGVARLGTSEAEELIDLFKKLYPHAFN